MYVYMDEGLPFLEDFYVFVVVVVESVNQFFFTDPQHDKLLLLADGEERPSLSLVLH